LVKKGTTVSCSWIEQKKNALRLKKYKILVQGEKKHKQRKETTVAFLINHRVWRKNPGKKSGLTLKIPHRPPQGTKNK